MYERNVATDNWIDSVSAQLIRKSLMMIYKKIRGLNEKKIATSSHCHYYKLLEILLTDETGEIGNCLLRRNESIKIE